MRKMSLLEQCGDEKHFVIRSNGVASNQLLCGLRVHLMNEHEMDVFCKKQIIQVPNRQLLHCRFCSLCSTTVLV
jgi:hypothetical protein